MTKKVFPMYEPLLKDVFNNARSTGHKGAVSEALAIAWLLKKGLEVFKNVAQHGPADLVTFDPDTGEFSLFDVKSSSAYRHKGDGRRYNHKHLTQKQIALGIRLIVVFPDGRIEC